MIPESHIPLFKSAASTAIGTCDKDMNPHFTRVFGLQMGDAPDELKIVVPQVTAATCLAQLREHNRIALSCNQVDNFTVQYKGEVINIRESTPEENALAERAKQHILDILIAEMGNELAEHFNGFIVSPGYTLTMKVREMYNQTPGKSAGQKIA